LAFPSLYYWHYSNNILESLTITLKRQRKFPKTLEIVIFVPRAVWQARCGEGLLARCGKVTQRWRGSPWETLTMQMA